MGPRKDLVGTNVHVRKVHGQCLCAKWPTKARHSFINDFNMTKLHSLQRRQSLTINGFINGSEGMESNFSLHFWVRICTTCKGTLLFSSWPGEESRAFGLNWGLLIAKATFVKYVAKTLTLKKNATSQIVSNDVCPSLSAISTF